VSNLPYSISSPAVVDLLEWEVTVGRMYLMLQKEVADRLTAAPGRSEYGPLTVYVDYWASTERLFNMPRHAFWPAPEVSSTLVRVTRRPERRRTEEYDTFAAVVRKLFESRRKTLAHILRAGWGDEEGSRIMQQVGLDPKGRVGELSTGDFEAIARAAGAPRGQC
jgi:16S rRNA (adenine1518-N6/adenine1519-N6)-dimethyltransferase